MLKRIHITRLPVSQGVVSLLMDNTYPYMYAKLTDKQVALDMVLDLKFELLRDSTYITKDKYGTIDKIIQISNNLSFVASEDLSFYNKVKKYEDAARIRRAYK